MQLTPRIEESDLYTRYIWEGVREGLWPFLPQKVELWTQIDVDYRRIWIGAAALFSDGYCLERVVSGRRDDIEGDPTAEYVRIGQKLAENFRNRDQGVVIEPNIVLGEY